MIIRNQNGILVWDDGTPVFEMGLIFLEYLEHTANNNGYAWGYNAVTNTWNVNEPTVENIYKELDIIAAEGWRVLRGRSLPSYYPLKWTNAFGPASEWDTPAYWAKVDAYFDTMELMLDYMASKGLGIMFDIWPGPSTFADYLYTIDDTIRISDWGKPDSFFFGAVKKITQRLCSRFANHPAVMAWEVMGEWDGYSFYGYPPGYASAERGGRGFRDDADKLTDELLIAYQTNIIAAIREVDTTGRFIGSGIFGQKDVQNDDRFIDRWLALNGPTDGASVHHYNGFPAGNHDNSALRDHLTFIRKKAYEAGKPLYIGEHAMQNDHMYLNELGYQRSDVEYDAIIDAGVQLSFHWEYRGGPDRQATELDQWRPGELGIHPNTTWTPAKQQYDMVHSKMLKMRETEWPGNVEEMSLPEFTYKLPTSAIATDRTNKYILPWTTRQDGMCISFWWNPRSFSGYGQDVFVSSFDDAGTATALGNYRFPEGNNGFFIRSTYTSLDAGVRLSNGELYSTGMFSMDVLNGNYGGGQYAKDEWVHVCIQVINPPYAWDWSTGAPGPYNVPGLRLYANGVVKGFIHFDQATQQYQPANSGLVIGGLNDDRVEQLDNLMNRGHGGIADLRSFNRPLRDKEVYELYLNNRVPYGAVSGHWTFENGSLVDDITGRSGYMHTGVNMAETITNMPTSAWRVPYVYTGPEITNNNVIQIARGNTAFIESYAGAEGEIVANLDTNQIHVMDGVKLGGHPTKLRTKQTTSSRLGYGNRRLYELDNTIVDVAHNVVYGIGAVLPNTNNIYNDSKYLRGNGIKHVMVPTGDDLQDVLNILNIDNIGGIAHVTVDPTNPEAEIARLITISTYKNLNGFYLQGASEYIIRNLAEVYDGLILSNIDNSLTQIVDNVLDMSIAIREGAQIVFLTNWDDKSMEIMRHNNDRMRSNGKEI